MAEAFLDHADAQALDAAVERIGVSPRLTPRWRKSMPSGPAMTSSSSALSRTFAVIGPAVIEGDLERRDPGIGHEAEGRLEADDAAMARRDADRAGLVAADRHVDIAGGDQRGAARRGAAGGVAGLCGLCTGPVAQVWLPPDTQ